MPENAKTPQASGRGYGLLGSLKDALAAASREDQHPAVMKAEMVVAERASPSVGLVALAPSAPPALPIAAHGDLQSSKQLEGVMASDATNEGADRQGGAAAVPSAEEAARAVRGSVTLKPQERHVEFNEPPTTRVVRKPMEARRGSAKDARPDSTVDEVVEVSAPARTQLVRGRQKLVRNDFTQDPVVAWLVVVGGPGLGAFRPVFEGNNTIGRATTQRIPIDFGDDAISSEEQAYIRYDSADRSFLFVPNLAKTNVVSVNDKRPTGAVELAHMDVITVGRTQLVFVPFCGPDFDWAELAEVKD